MNYIVVLQTQLQGMARAAIALLPSIAIGIVVVLLAWLLARFAASIVHRVTGHTRLRSDLKDLLETLVRVTIWVIGFLLAATIIIPGFTFGGMVAGLGIGAVAIGFAFQDIFKNFLAGVLIMLREKMRIGDLVQCEDIRGKVEHISLRETHIRQLSGELTIVPNSMLFEKPVQIVTDQHLRRDDILVPIDFDDDIEAARAAIATALQGVSTIAKERPVQVFAKDFDAGAGVTSLLVRYWTDAIAHNNTEVRSDAMLAIIAGLAEVGIALPSSTTELVDPDRLLTREAAD